MGALRFLSVLLVVPMLFALASPARTQCQTGHKCDIGAWEGPWDWNYDVCSDYACPQTGPVEFYHGGLISVGPYAGMVVLLRAGIDATCAHTNPQSLQTWLFNPASPTGLIRVVHPQVPHSMTCAGNSWDRDGRLVLAGGQQGTNERVFRFKPKSLGMLTPPPGGSCNPAQIAGSLCWMQTGDLRISRYYPSVIPLIRWAIDSPMECTDLIESASAAIGGPPFESVGNVGTPVWELLHPDRTTWSCAILPEGYLNWDQSPSYPFSVSEQYERKPDSDEPSPLLDSYPRALQLSGVADGQVFVAGDTRTTNYSNPADTDYAVQVGIEAWTMKVPFANMDPIVPSWEMWKSTPTAVEHDYGNAVIIFRNSSGGVFQQNRILVFGGRRWSGGIAVPNDEVEEFIPGDNAASTTATWQLKHAMASKRVYSNAVVLPDGMVFVVGGNQDPDSQSGSSGPGNPQFRPELYNPGNAPTSAGSTKFLAQSNVVSSQGMPTGSMPRLYHSMALLLPDASVLVVGGKVFGLSGTPGQFPDSRLSGEVFYPPYLYEGNSVAVRPSIDGMTLSTPTFQRLSTPGLPKTFEVAVTTSNGHIAKVSVVRSAAVTHHFHSDQRYIELGYTGGQGVGQQTITVTAPLEDIAPQGYYMLFVFEEKASNTLVPAISRFIQFI